MSIRALSIEMEIARRAAEAEEDAVFMIGGDEREAIAAYHRVLKEILSIARRYERVASGI
jgi:hypothetical protein